MAHYLIEFRFFGAAKREMKQLIREVDKRFGLRRARHHRPVPHISLVGPFTTKNQKQLVSDFKKICQKQNIMHFKVRGYGTFENSRVVYINIEPDEKLDAFRWELSRNLQQYCSLQPYDLKRKFEYHATAAMKLSPDKFNKVKDHIQKKSKPNFKNVLMRVTLIKNQKILYEYDFLLKKLLSRREAKSKHILTKTFDKLKNNRENECNMDSVSLIPEFEMGETGKGLFDKLVSQIWKKRVFFISDLHLDHTNIIKYCNRPFNSVEEMNKTVITNWNATVRKKDLVYFLGDMAFGRGSRKTDYWLKKLNGKIVFVRGNHDRSKNVKFYDKLILKYDKRKFLLVHDPKNIPKDWKGWVIHGHVHDNKPHYPLVNKEAKRINVSAELLNYNPMLLKDLIKLVS